MSKNCSNCVVDYVAHCLSCDWEFSNWSAATIEPTPPRDTYDLAEMITTKVLDRSWSTDAVADAIQKYVEASK